MAREHAALQDAIDNEIDKRRRLEELEERSKAEVQDQGPDFRETRVENLRCDGFSACFEFAV